MLRTPDGRVQSVGVRLTADGHGADALKPVDAVFGFCGGAALLRAGHLRSVGGVPAHFFCYYEDTDTSWRLRLAGHRVIPVISASASHLHGATTLPGSTRFHLWNERNRLLTLLRCAPFSVAARELARFAAITFALPLRRAVQARSRPGQAAPGGLDRKVPEAANFRVAVRLRVLAEVAVGLPAALHARRRIGQAARVSRREVWRTWAGA